MSSALVFLNSQSEPQVTVTVAELVDVDLISVNRFKMHLKMLGLAMEWSWEGGSSQGQPLGAVSGLSSCVDGVVTKVRKTGCKGAMGPNPGCPWNTQISVRQHRSQGGSWGCQLRGEIWAGI